MIKEMSNETQDDPTKSAEGAGSAEGAPAPRGVGRGSTELSPETKSAERGVSNSAEGQELAEPLEEIKRTMEEDVEKPEEKSSATAVMNIERSPLKESAMLDPTKPSEFAPNIIDLVQRYEEQPTMKDVTLRVVKAKKPLQKPRGRRGRKPGYSEETVFDNIEEDKSGRTKSEKERKAAKRKEQGGEGNFGYDNLGEASKEDEEKRAAEGRVPIREKEGQQDYDAYENLPTPPKSPKDKEKKRKSLQKQAATGQKVDAGEMRTAERMVTKREQARKHGLVSDKTLALDKTVSLSREMATQRDGRSRMDMQDLLELDETIATGLYDMDEDVNDLETAISTHQDKKRLEMKYRRGRVRSRKPTRASTIVDILSIMCLLPLMNDYWVVPVEAVENGGRFGYGYMMLIFVVQMTIVHQGSILLKHLSLTFYENLSIGTCSELIVEDWSKCSSIFLDSHCVARNKSYAYYAQGFCWNVPVFDASEVTTSQDSYIKFLLEPEFAHGFDFGIFIRYLLQLSIIALLALNGPIVTIFCLAVLTIIFVLIVLTDNVFSFNRRSLAMLLRLSNFQRLLKIDPWVTVLRLAFSSSGLGEVTVFCMSSFRNPRAKYFLTATFVIIGKILICILGLFSLLNNIDMLDKFVPNSKKAFSPKHSDITHSSALMVDVYSMFHEFSRNLYDHGELVYVYHIITSLAAMFMIFTVARKHDADSFIERVPFVGAYAILCCFYTSIACLDFFQVLMNRHRSLILNCSLHFYMAFTIFLLIYGYGIKDYHEDIRAVFPRTNAKLRMVREIFQSIAFLLSVVALLLLQGYELVVVGFEERKRLRELAAKGTKWELTQEILSIVLALLPFLLPIGFCIYRCFTVKRKNWLQISHEHPTIRFHIIKAKLAKKRRAALKSRISRRTQATSTSQTITGDLDVFDVIEEDQINPEDFESTKAVEQKTGEKVGKKEEEKKSPGGKGVVSQSKASKEGISGSVENVGDGKGGGHDEKLKSKELTKSR
ncbi:hypothetical protein RB195_020609 [Necator americanus]|uniref:Transporter, cation channel family protein n=1 Tax=Necator americanus TaxID=51031 RepID=A0ABR1CL20_NECAM